MKQHTSRFLNLVTESKKRIKEISSDVLREKMNQQEPMCLVDIREDSEWSSGHIPGAIHLSKGIIERDIEKLIPDINAPIVVYCSGGFRGALVADALQTMGYQNVTSLSDGTQGWTNAGYPLEKMS